MAAGKTEVKAKMELKNTLGIDHALTLMSIPGGKNTPKQKLTKKPRP